MKYIPKLLQNPLFKIASLNGLNMGVKVLTGFISSKAIAYFIGPSGMALMGNLRSFIAILETAGMLGLQNVIVQNVAKNKEETLNKTNFVKSIFWFLLVFSLLLSSFIFIFSNPISKIIFANQVQFYFIVKLIAIILPFQIVHLFFISVLNGNFLYKKITIITIYSYIIGLLISVVLMWNFGIFGALVAMVILSSVQVLFSGYFFFKLIDFKLIFLPFYINWKTLKNTIPLGSMALFSAIISPLLYIYIRNSIIETSTIVDAGFYEAMQRISGFYMLFISSFISFYFLPELSKSTDLVHIRNLSSKYYKTIMPFFVLLLFLLFISRELLIKIIFTADFLPISDFFGIQLLGDFFRALSLILGIRFYAHKIVKAYFVTEIFSFLILFFSSFILIPIYGTFGAILAYCLTYFLYFLILKLYFYFYDAKNNGK